jgi:hypothetical protein
MAHSTIPTSNMTEAPIGTPLRPNPSLPHGYRALNPSIANTTQVQPSRHFVPPGYNVAAGYIPTPLLGGTGLGGSNPIGSTDQSFTFGYQILVGNPPYAGGKPQFGGQPQLGTQTQLGGKPQARVHNPLYG